MYYNHWFCFKADFESEIQFFYVESRSLVGAINKYCTSLNVDEDSIISVNRERLGFISPVDRRLL